MARFTQFRCLRRLAITLGLAGGVLPAAAAKKSTPAQVMMVATMPATFSLLAARPTITDASGTVQVQSRGRGAIIVRGQLHSKGGNAILRIPVTLAANTRSFVVQANIREGHGRGTAYLIAPGLMARRMPLHGQPFLAMAVAKGYGREFFVLDHPLHSTLELVFQDLPTTQIEQFSLVLSMRELGY